MIPLTFLSISSMAFLFTQDSPQIVTIKNDAFTQIRSLGEYIRIMSQDLEEFVSPRI